MARLKPYSDEPENRDVRLKSTYHDDVYTECQRAKKNAVKVGKRAARKK